MLRNEPIISKQAVHKASGTISLAEATKELTTFFHETFSPLMADNVLTRKEVRNLGRELGKKLITISAILTNQNDLPSLILVVAELFDKNIQLPVDKSAAWGNFTKGFTGDSGSLLSAFERNKIINQAEEDAPQFAAMFFRHSALETESKKNSFHKINQLLNKLFPELSEATRTTIGLSMYNMSRLKKELLQEQTTTRKLETTDEAQIYLENSFLRDFEQRLTPALKSHKDYSPEWLCSTVQKIARLGAVYDKAAYRINCGQKVQAKKKMRTFMHKHHLFFQLNNPEKIDVAICPETRSFASALVSRGSYIAKLFLDTIVSYPQNLQKIIAFGDTQSLQSNMALLNLEQDIPAPYPSWHSLRAYVWKEFLRLGLRCLTEEPKEHQSHISTSLDIALLSEFIFRQVALTEFNHLADIHGKPTCSFAFFIGGANARREYPTFDYDSYCVYESDGSTISNQTNHTTIPHKDFFIKLNENIAKTLRTLGADFDSGFLPCDPVSHELFWAISTDDFKNLIAKSTDAHLELRLRINQRLIFGDAPFSEQFQKWIDQEVQARRQHILSTRFKEIEKLSIPSHLEKLNLKLSPGGLRQGVLLWQTCSCIFSTHFSSMSEFANFLQQKQFISEAEKIFFLNAYDFLLISRARMDMQYGRNAKYIPHGDELVAFAKSIGYHHSRILPADIAYLNDLDEKMSVVSNFCLKTLSQIRDFVLEQENIDISDSSEADKLATITDRKREEYLAIQAFRTETGFGEFFH
jgi:hypothetical protein